MNGVELYGPGGTTSDIVTLLLHDLSVSVDALTAGAGQLTVVKAIATTAQALNGHPVIDGYQTIDGDVVLLTAQASPVDNGLWTTFAGVWERPADFKVGRIVTSRTVIASVGTDRAGTVWALQVTGPVTVGTTAQTWLNAPVAGLTAELAGINSSLDTKATESAVLHNSGTEDRDGVLRLVGDLLTKSGRPRFDARSFGATPAQRAVFMDGNLKPLSLYYASLATAQAAYPDIGVAALTDQLDWAIAQTAINAAMTAGDPADTLRFGLGELHFDVGTCYLHRPLKVWSTMGFLLTGAGWNTALQAIPGAVMENVLDLNGVSFSIFRDFLANGPVGTGQVNAVIDWYWNPATAANGSTGTRFTNIWTGRNAGRCITGFGVSRISVGAVQVDGTSFNHVTLTGGSDADPALWQQAWYFGDGTVGNQTDLYLYGSGVALWKYGAKLNGAKRINFDGGSWGGLDTAFFLGGFGVVVEGINFEGCKRLVDQAGATAAPSTLSIKNIEWDFSQLPVDGEWFRYYQPGSVILENLRGANAPLNGAVLNFRLTPAGPGNDLTVLVKGLQAYAPLESLFPAAKISGPVRVVVEAYTQLDPATATTVRHIPAAVHVTTSTTTADRLLQSLQAGDTDYRFLLLSDGTAKFGAGGSGQPQSIGPGGTVGIPVAVDGLLTIGQPGVALTAGTQHLHIRKPSGSAVAGAEWFENFESNAFTDGGGSYVDRTYRWGYGQDANSIKALGEPLIFYQLETKFRQNGGAPSGSEEHLNFGRPSDSGVFNRPHSIFMEHVTGNVSTNIAGSLTIGYSNSGNTRFQFQEFAGANFYDGCGLVLNWNSSVAPTLGANIALIQDAQFPAIALRNHLTDAVRLDTNVLTGVLTVHANGGVVIRPPGGTGGNTTLIAEQAAGGQTGDLLAMRANDQFSVFAGFDANGYPYNRLHSAPADLAIANGELKLWFDQTDGAAKLMVKAKQADGTVRTGSLALA